MNRFTEGSNIKVESKDILYVKIEH